MAALPLTRHDWHGDWNYTLRPEDLRPQIAVAAPDPFDQPSPDLAWLCHPALTGLTAPEWDALITALTTLHHQQREADLDKRRGHRPRMTAPRRRTPPRPHPRRPAPGHRPAPPPRPAPGRRRRPVQRPPRNHQPAHPRHPPDLLDQAGHTIEPAPQPLATLDDLYNLARTAGITIPTESRQRVNDLQALRGGGPDRTVAGDLRPGPSRVTRHIVIDPHIGMVN